MENNKENKEINETIKRIIKSTNKTCTIVLKANNKKDKIVKLSIASEGEVFTTSENLDSGMIKSALMYLIENCTRIFLYDLKDFIRSFTENKSHLRILSENYRKFFDVKLYISNLLSKDVLLYSDDVYKITGIDFNAHSNTFFQLKNSGLKNEPYQIINHNLLKNLMEDEVRTINILQKHCDSVFLSDYQPFIDSQHKASIIYACIESNYVSIDLESSKNLNKYFEDYEQNTSQARSIYRICASRTGRTHSRLNSMRIEDRISLISSRDYLLSVDYVAYESKLLFEILEISPTTDDIYTEIGDHLGKDRDWAKLQFIACAYDSKSVDKRVSSYLEDTYSLMTKIDELKKVYKRDDNIVQFMGHYFHFNDDEDYNHKIINHLVQCYATHKTHSTIFEFFLETLDLDYDFVAVIHDELIIDVSKVDFLEIYLKLKEIVNVNFNYVSMTSKIMVGKNLKDMTIVNR